MPGELRRSAAGDAALPQESALMRGENPGCCRGSSRPPFSFRLRKENAPLERWKRNALRVGLRQTFGASSRRGDTQLFKTGAETCIAPASITLALTVISRVAHSAAERAGQAAEGLSGFHHKFLPSSLRDAGKESDDHRTTPCVPQTQGPHKKITCLFGQVIFFAGCVQSGSLLHRAGRVLSGQDQREWGPHPLRRSAAIPVLQSSADSCGNSAKISFSSCAAVRESARRGQ